MSQPSQNATGQIVGSVRPAQWSRLRELADRASALLEAEDGRAGALAGLVAEFQAGADESIQRYWQSIRNRDGVSDA